jgi:HD-GYP domain-containing protein (c-di-GMP phosphodiesterase class II)
MSRLAPFTAAMGVWDPDLGGHAGRVSAHAETIARRLGWPEEQLADVRLGAALHDVGKVSVRPEVLCKTGSLTADELAHIRVHPVEGVWLIAGVRTLAPAVPYVLFHHERWDGDGYPTGRAGVEIPVEGRILAVADAFDAMTSLRPYRPPLSVDEALDEVVRCSGTQFDPLVARTFLQAWGAGEIEAPEPLAAAG